MHTLVCFLGGTSIVCIGKRRKDEGHWEGRGCSALDNVCRGAVSHPTASICFDSCFSSDILHPNCSPNCPYVMLPIDSQVSVSALLLTFRRSFCTIASFTLVCLWFLPLPSL